MYSKKKGLMEAFTFLLRNVNILNNYFKNLLFTLTLILHLLETMYKTMFKIRKRSDIAPVIFQYFLLLEENFSFAKINFFSEFRRSFIKCC